MCRKTQERSGIFHTTLRLGSGTPSPYHRLPLIMGTNWSLLSTFCVEASVFCPGAIYKDRAFHFVIIDDLMFTKFKFLLL